MALLYVRELVSPEPAQEKRAELEAEGLVKRQRSPLQGGDIRAQTLWMTRIREVECSRQREEQMHRL